MAMNRPYGYRLLCWICRGAATAILMAAAVLLPVGPSSPPLGAVPVPLCQQSARGSDVLYVSSQADAPAETGLSSAQLSDGDPVAEQQESVLSARVVASSRGGDRPSQATTTSTATSTPTATATSTNTPAPTRTPAPTNTQAPTSTPAPTHTSAPAASPAPTGAPSSSTASTQSPQPSPIPAPQPPPSPQKMNGEGIAAIAMKYLGYRYAWGGSSPKVGFDCSGFIGYVYAEAGLPVPNHDLSGQLRSGPSVKRDQLQPGDLVFFQNTYRAGLSHGGIYIGGGQFIHAVEEGVGVRITNMADGYWSGRFLGASRPWDQTGR